MSSISPFADYLRGFETQKRTLHRWGESRSQTTYEALKRNLRSPGPLHHPRSQTTYEALKLKASLDIGYGVEGSQTTYEALKRVVGGQISGASNVRRLPTRL